mgnify:CR=1 FL=1
MHSLNAGSTSGPLIKTNIYQPALGVVVAAAVGRVIVMVVDVPILARADLAKTHRKIRYHHRGQLWKSLSNRVSRPRFHPQRQSYRGIGQHCSISTDHADIKGRE